MQNKKYILFDLDGTVSDPKTGITNSVRYALEHYGIHVENADALEGFIGPPLRDSFMERYGFSPEKTEEAVMLYREYFSDRGIYENELYPGMKKLLKALVQAKKTVIMATSKPWVFAQRILEHFDIADFFTFVSGSELDGGRSDKAEVIRRAMEQVGIKNPTEAVMIGDRRYDIAGAKAVGMESIGVLFGYGSKEELEAVGADRIAATVNALGKLLLGEFL